MQCAYDVLDSHLWPIWLYQISPDYLIKRMIFGKKLPDTKFFILSTAFV